MLSSTKSLTSVGSIGILLTLAFMSGCTPAANGPERTGSVVGTVTYKGQPVTEGTVEISDPKVGGGGTGVLGPDGKFEIKSVMAGKYQVSIQPPLVEDRGDGKTAPRKVAKTVNNIPEKYRFEGTSGFSIDVLDAEQTEANFKME